MPSPAGAGCILSLAILRSLPPNNSAGLPPDLLREIVKYWAPVGGLIIALLMVSRIPYPHVTKQMLRGRRHFGHLVQVILIAFVILLIRELALVLIFWAYALGFAVRFGILRSLRQQRLPAPNLDEGLRH